MPNSCYSEAIHVLSHWFTPVQGTNQSRYLSISQLFNLTMQETFVKIMPGTPPFKKRVILICGHINTTIQGKTFMCLRLVIDTALNET